MNFQKVTCPIRGCSTQILPVILMCRKHWDMVPADLQEQSVTLYREMRSKRTKKSKDALVSCNEIIITKVNHAIAS